VIAHEISLTATAGHVMNRFALVPAALALSIALSAHAQSAEAPQQRMIVVTGEGEVLAKPDQARISAAVVTQAPTAQMAAEGNATAMSRVMGALNVLGIAQNKIQTSNYSIQPQYSATQRAISTYQATNQVTVVVDDLARIGAISDALVRAGANQTGGINFTIADPKPIADRARQQAVADAMAKAQTLAAAAGVRLGPLLTIQEGPGGIRPLQFAAPPALEAAAATTPIIPGDQPIIVAVTMTFAIQ
jgi:uncharacterized protein YggE